jgi:Na+/H+-translocating membrane pyrophosphatase
MIYAGSVLNWIMKKDKGSPEMQKISDYIMEGSEGFFIAQYGTIFKLSFVFAIAIFLLYWSKVMNS